MTNAAACAADAEPAAAATALFLASAALRRAESLPESARAARSAVLPAALALVKGASASALFGGSFRGTRAPPRTRGFRERRRRRARSLRNALRAFFAALGSPVASRVTKCGHAEVTALLFEETQTETAETALVDRASVSSFDAGAVAVAECAAAACASAGERRRRVRGVAGARARVRGDTKRDKRVENKRTRDASKRAVAPGDVLPR